MSPSLASRTRSSSSSAAGGSAAFAIAPREPLLHTREHRARHGLPRAAERRKRRDHLLEARQQLAALGAVAYVALDPVALARGQLGVDVLGHVRVRPTVVAREADPCERTAHARSDPTRARGTVCHRTGSHHARGQAQEGSSMNNHTATFAAGCFWGVEAA